MEMIDELLPLFLAACAQTDAEACTAMLEYRADYPGVDSPFVGNPTVVIRCGAGYVDDCALEDGVLRMSVRARGSALHLAVPVGAIVSFGMRYARAVDLPQTEQKPPAKSAPKMRLV